jgi:predicted GNAT family acetyltransferase
VQQNESNVVDEVDEHRFVYRTGADEAELVYRAEPGRLVLVHTGVPDAFRGQGIGGRLVEAAIDRAAQRGETVVAECSYARRWLEEHPDVAERVTVAS